jgi:hypothetical protein
MNQDNATQPQSIRKTSETPLEQFQRAHIQAIKEHKVVTLRIAQLGMFPVELE